MEIHEGVGFESLIPPHQDPQTNESKLFPFCLERKRKLFLHAILNTAFN